MSGSQTTIVIQVPPVEGGETKRTHILTAQRDAELLSIYYQPDGNITADAENEVTLSLFVAWAGEEAVEEHSWSYVGEPVAVLRGAEAFVDFSLSDAFLSVGPPADTLYWDVTVAAGANDPGGTVVATFGHVA